MLIYKIFRRLAMRMAYSRFSKIGKNVNFDPISSHFSYRTISIGSDVYIGPNAHFSSSHSSILIGSFVMFGPNVSIYGGNHITDFIGVPMIKVKKCGQHVDPDVIIEHDVWVGGNVVILPGVRIARGCIIGAGSIVTKNTLPYGIYVGNPARRISERFSGDAQKMHEICLQKLIAEASV